MLTTIFIMQIVPVTDNKLQVIYPALNSACAKNIYYTRSKY